MLLTIAAAPIVFALATAPDHADTEPPTPAVRPCRAAPPSADEACKACMDNACQAYITLVTQCGSNQVCISTAWAVYELSLLNCLTCNPEASAWRTVLAVLPPSERAWLQSGSFGIPAH